VKLVVLKTGEEQTAQNCLFQMLEFLWILRLSYCKAVLLFSE
jgi:5-methylcytosine-specific restriction endonuclease McrBC regulatory subunit McrC